MWLTDFRARPAMKDVVVRLEACLFHELQGGANDNDLNPDKASLDDPSPPRGGTAREQQLELEILELKAENAALTPTSQQLPSPTGDPSA